MARYKNKLYDSSNGSVGNAVVYQMYGKTYIRTKPTALKDRKSEAQLNQRLRFDLVLQFLKPFKDLVRITFANEAIGHSAFHAAQSYNLKNALTGTYPGTLLDRQKALLSYGPLPLPEKILITRQPEGFKFQWAPGDSTVSDRDKDTLVVIGQPVYGDGEVDYRFTGSRRTDGSYFWPTSLIQHTKVHLWIAFQDSRQTEMSNSLYLGQW